MCNASEAFLPPRKSSFLPALFGSLVAADAILGRSKTTALLVAMFERMARLDDTDGWKASTDCCVVMIAPMMIAACDFIVVDYSKCFCRQFLKV